MTILTADGVLMNLDQLTPLDIALLQLHPGARYHWCGGDPKAPGYDPMPCACCGCANGVVFSLGLTYDDWARWVEEHPAPPDAIGRMQFDLAWDRISGVLERRERMQPKTLAERLKIYKARKALERGE